MYDGTTLLASGVPAASGTDAGRVKFESTSSLFDVPANDIKQITVKALTGSVTGVAGGTDTGQDLVAYMHSGDFDSVSGATTITTLTGSTAAGNTKRLYKTIPTVTVSSPSSSVLTTGEVEALKFTVAADAAGDVEWSRIEFTTALSNATLTANTITVRYAGSNLTLTTKTIAATAGEGVIGLTTPERITKGTSKTYSLLLDVSAVAGSTTAASLTTKLRLDETSADAGAALLTQINDGDSFVWTDRGVLPHSTTSADWHNGYKVKTLPSGTKALVK